MIYFLFFVLSFYQALAQVSVNYNFSQHCLSGDDLKSQLRGQVRDTIRNIPQFVGNVPQCPCGGFGNWRKIVHLNMTDQSQICPANWTLINNSDLRGCGRSTWNTGSCDSTYFPSGGIPYTRVCGMVNAIQYGSTEAFYVSTSSFWRQFQVLESAYVVGVSVTHGSPGSRRHIWSFASSIGNGNGIDNCPCSNSAPWPYQVYSFVNDNYFCETGNNGGPYPSGTEFFSDNPLWDGTGCYHNSSCCSFNSPPWFCTSLPESTTDDLEMRICLLDDSGENVIVTLAEIYVLD